jgi:hypothetical protein
MDPRACRTRSSLANRARNLALALVVASCGEHADPGRGATSGGERVFDVQQGGDIQAALEAAADAGSGRRIVRVHAGTYRPTRPAQALIWFNARHDGITLEAVGEVVLSAANEALADRKDPSFPALVNHVVYFGDGVGASTVMRGFVITGANHFVTTSEDPGPVQPFVPVSQLNKAQFFFNDGGGIKVFGRSYPTLENLVVRDNYASPCGGGVSVEQRGFDKSAVTFRNCVFRANRCQITGSAIDLLPGSSALIENCLFVGNVANLGEDTVSPRNDLHNFEHGSGALTVFAGSKARVVRCTFTDNWNGADDQGQGNEYRDCIFWKNTRGGGICPLGRYELDILDASAVSGCRLGGGVADLRGKLDPRTNVLDAADPQFDELFQPRAKSYESIGYRAARAQSP